MATLTRINRFLLSLGRNNGVRFSSSFKASELQVELAQDHEKHPKPDSKDLVFGKQFSDHMLEVDWVQGQGWGKPSIHPLRPLSLHPAAKVFHYALELFEGMKAFHGVDDKIRLFRPDKNAERMFRTAQRLSFPEFSQDEFVECVRSLVRIDADWVPQSTSCSLYIRPTMIGTEPQVGVSKSTEVKLFVITGPVGPYYPTGFKPVTLLADPQYVRAWEGGCGNYKMGSNYGPTIHISTEAQTKHNCQQVLWLYGPEHRVTEVGAMNIFMFWINENGEKELITPPLDSGLILPGVTRLSLLEMTRGWNEFQVVEKEFTMKQIAKALQENRVLEMFGAGTACVVCPVGAILYENNLLQIPTMDNGAPLTNRLYKSLTDMQFGRVNSDWTVDL